MRVRVDNAKCKGYGTCTLIAPAVFDLDDDGHVLLQQEQVDGDLRAEVTQAVRECPERALSLEA